ncbi:uncharacterized protein JN550_011633 [Neoarthrinium moseri]|uniref:uncharacterized protein n=1 Tax=Neoarthrinium moseri TaxID=1658444 RepID=UPI001FDD350B|nr:uncharacterized protein JN550_011633 [Neoarthrinium moseri]KAI1860255.1 hypothetical protein JN550_011633 [Neoarthrinium moseri]
MSIIMGRLVLSTIMFTVILFFISITSRALRKDSTWMLPAWEIKQWQESYSSSAVLYEKLALAERLWKQTIENRKQMLDESGSGRTFPDGYIYPYNVWDFARPSFFCPHDMERVGTLGDGGKVVCGMSRYEKTSPGPSSEQNIAPPLIVYSFGVNDDSSFEARLLERTNAEIWGYDYSVDAWAKDIRRSQLSRAHFKKAGLGKKTDEKSNPPFYTVQDLMHANGHNYVDIVKMDIEGFEFDVLSSLTAFLRSTTGDNDNTTSTIPFGQLLVEIHLFPGATNFHVPKDIHEWIQWWTELEELGLRPVNNEDNWIGDIGQGKPWFMEYTLINAVDTQRNKLLWA